MITLMALLLSGCVWPGQRDQASTLPHQSACPISDSDRQWMLEGLASWRRVLRDILQAPDDMAPQVVFYDSTCSYTRAALPGKTPGWQVEAHHGHIRLPRGHTAPPTPYAMNAETGVGESFVMITLPSIWARVAPPSEIPLHHFLEGVLFHEFTHAYQVATTPSVSIRWLIDRPGSPAHLSSASVQQNFTPNPAYVCAPMKRNATLSSTPPRHRRTRARVH